jgi:hypothetical protein
MKQNDRKTETVIARIPADLKLKVIKKAKRRNVKESEIIRLALVSFLSEK